MTAKKKPEAKKPEAKKTAPAQQPVPQAVGLDGYVIPEEIDVTATATGVPVAWGAPTSAAQQPEPEPKVAKKPAAKR